MVLVLTVLSFVFKLAGASDAFASVSWGWSFGAFIGLAAAVRRRMNTGDLARIGSPNKRRRVLRPRPGRPTLDLS